jgi:hypothetical protein
MTETERITNEVYDRYAIDEELEQALSRIGLHKCRTKGCVKIVVDEGFCPRCCEELYGQPYPLANVFKENPLLTVAWLLFAACAGGLVVWLAVWIGGKL